MIVAKVLADRAAAAGEEWAERFEAPEGSSEETAESVRTLIASSFAAGYISGYGVGLDAAAEVVSRWTT